MKLAEEPDEFADKYDFIPSQLLPLVVEEWTNAKIQENNRLNDVKLFLK